MSTITPTEWVLFGTNTRIWKKDEENGLPADPKTSKLLTLLGCTVLLPI